MNTAPDRRVTRISRRPAQPLQITFSTERRTRSWEPADADVDAGSPQDVPASTADAIEGDSTLAPHFRVEPIAPSEAEMPEDADGNAQEA